MAHDRGTVQGGHGGIVHSQRVRLRIELIEALARPLERTTYATANFDDSGTAHSICQARFERILDRELREPFPELAGHRVRFLTLFVWFEDRVPIEVSRVDATLTTSTRRADETSPWPTTSIGQCRQGPALHQPLLGQRGRVLADRYGEDPPATRATIHSVGPQLSIFSRMSMSVIAVSSHQSGHGEDTTTNPSPNVSRTPPFCRAPGCTPVHSLLEHKTL